MRALTKIRKFLSQKETKRISEVYIMSTLKYCTLIWMFCVKTENKPINKVRKCTIRLIYNTEDATYEDLLETDKLRTIHENNIHTLLVKICKSVHYISPSIMWNPFDLKRNRYILRISYLLKLLDTSTCQDGTQALCFKRSLL